MSGRGEAGKMSSDSRRGSQDGRGANASLSNKDELTSPSGSTVASSTSGRRAESSENGKKKTKEEKPPTKVVIRRLPPSMTKEVFLSQISPVPDHDYFYFVQGDPTAGLQMGFSRAYINFINQEDLFHFTETYDNYVFVDNKGQEYPAIVEFAPFQRIPKQRTKKRDPLCGSIETDQAYIAFKEALETAAAEAVKPDVTSKQHFFETEVSSGTPQEETTTPLLEFLRQKRLDRVRIRDERREEKKKKEAERKMKQKITKERKSDVEEEPKDIKVLQSKDKRDSVGKETRNGRRADKEKLSKETRTREFKNRNKHFPEEKLRIEKKEKEDKKDSTLTDKKNAPEVQEKGEPDNPALGADKGKPAPEKKRNDGRKKSVDGVEGKVEGEEPKKTRSERNRTFRKERERRRRDYLAKKNLEKKNMDAERRRSKTFKNSSESNDNVSASKSDDKEDMGMGKGSEGTSMLEESPIESSSFKDTGEAGPIASLKRRSSLESDPFEVTKDPFIKSRTSKRRSSLESGNVPDFRDEPLRQEKCRKGKSGGGADNSGRRESKSSAASKSRSLKSSISFEEKRGAESDSGGEKVLRAKEDKDCKSDQDENKEKDPRTGRRIRNKDRPSIQIYRPGMGKLSKQRLEKEKPLGSSTEVDSPPHSPSPAPKNKPSGV